MPVNMKNMIADAFLAMTARKSVDKITVTDLVEACDISRQTFYYHFQDILEVIEWAGKRVVQKGVDLSLAAETPEEAIRTFFSVAAEHYGLLQKLLNSQKRVQIEHLLLQGVRTYLEEVSRKKAPERPLSYADAELELNFCAWGFTGLLLSYCGDKHLDLDQISHQVCQLLQRNQSS